ncbi:uncharacterized protein LOC118278944 [Spodoptera frugiperda]|uniref:Uncharacterized protein LOC118278944 n=1 Tax=Spodoptera frugiperda TaxID=7108 RepID=A0A9R0DI76_SPOFR|nr:uncharacterized protein LOC118278944 [Spodoptera frugiperda]
MSRQLGNVAHAQRAARAALPPPYTPPYNKYRYIPLHVDEIPEASLSSPAEEESSSRMPISEFILTALRTALDVVRNVNKQRAIAAAASATAPNNSTTAVAVRRTRTKAKNETVGTGRGFEDYYDEDHHHYEEPTTTPKPMKQKARYTDPWAGYYDWIINEGSFKFWSVFQLFTAALLLYACLSAIYYAKFNPILPDYDREYDDYFLERTVGRNARSLDSLEPHELPSGHSWINPRTFQFILDAISKHYEEE